MDKITKTICIISTLIIGYQAFKIKKLKEDNYDLENQKEDDNGGITWSY